jgi:transcriptional regulator with XRE-family HTH domain
MSDNTDTLKKVGLTLGARIRAQRLRHNMKISELAELTGLTSSTISQVERAQISPSIATLKKICDAMDIPIGYLFDNFDEHNKKEEKRHLPEGAISSHLARWEMFMPLHLDGISPIVHRENRKFLSPGPGIRYYLLNPNLSGPLEMIYNEFDPGSTTGPTLYTHPGVECALILSGELFVQIKDKTFLLKEGDSITFNSSDPHFLRNDADVMCTCIWVNTPPWF